MHGINSHGWNGEFYNVDTHGDTGDGIYDYFKKRRGLCRDHIAGHFPYTLPPAMDSHTGIWSGSGEYVLEPCRFGIEQIAVIRIWRDIIRIVLRNRSAKRQGKLVYFL